jgi:hypothetical protein
MILRLARLGGGMMIAGSVAFLLAGALVLGRRPTGIGVDSIGGIVVDLGLVLVVGAALLLAAAGQGPTAGTASRLGLAILAFGTLSNLASGIIIRAEDPSAMFTVIVLQLAIAIPATIVGWLVLGVGLLREGGPARLVGRALVGGVALIPVLVILANLGGTGLRFGELAAPVAGLAAVLILGAMGGLGFLALSDRWSWR